MSLNYKKNNYGYALVNGLNPFLKVPNYISNFFISKGNNKLVITLSYMIENVSILVIRYESLSNEYLSF